MSDSITFVGLDTHKDFIQVAMLEPGEKSPLAWRVVNRGPDSFRKLAKQLKREALGEVVCCYEAGPSGYSLARNMESQGVSCMVVAPSLIPRKPGERIKTDRRDAAKLANLLRAGQLTRVEPPSERDESVRDLCRGRDDVRRDLNRCRHRLSKFLLRRERRYELGKKAWTTRHRSWLLGLRFEDQVDQVVFNSYLVAVCHQEELLKTLDGEIEMLALEDPYRKPVGYLRCFRGIDTLTAMSIVAELYAFWRFASPRKLAGWLGLVPSEHSSGKRVVKGPITKTGNSHVRRLLVEAAWHYRHRPVVGYALKKRRTGQPERIIALADKALNRLCRRHSYLAHRGKEKNKANVAVARELACFIWSALDHWQIESAPQGC